MPTVIDFSMAILLGDLPRKPPGFLPVQLGLGRRHGKGNSRFRLADSAATLRRQLGMKK